MILLSSISPAARQKSTYRRKRVTIVVGNAVSVVCGLTCELLVLGDPSRKGGKKPA